MEDLWGNTQTPTPAKKKQQKPAIPPIRHMQGHCTYYGHAWQVVGLSYEKQCTICGQLCYCPGCASNPPQIALVIYCEKHKPSVTHS